jgi:hypothetical protein
MTSPLTPLLKRGEAGAKRKVSDKKPADFG